MLTLLRCAQVSADASIHAGSACGAGSAGARSEARADSGSTAAGAAEGTRAADRAAAEAEAKGGESNTDSDGGETVGSASEAEDVDDPDDVLVPIARARLALHAAVGAWGAHKRVATDTSDKMGGSASKEVRTQSAEAGL